MYAFPCESQATVGSAARVGGVLVEQLELEEGRRLVAPVRGRRRASSRIPQWLKPMRESFWATSMLPSASGLIAIGSPACARSEQSWVTRVFTCPFPVNCVCAAFGGGDLDPIGP